jgi:hypothetical protein
MRFLRRRRGAAADEGPTTVERGRYAARRGLSGLARLVMLVTGLVALTIVLGIVLILLEANEDNTIVDAILDAAKFLVDPFKNVFDLKRRKTEIAVNWGIAAVVYLMAGSIIARLLRR